MVTENLKIGQIIKRFRVINDIRQEDMAEKLGVSRATLINYEKGHTVINVDFLKKLERNYPNFKINDEYDNKPQILENNLGKRNSVSAPIAPPIEWQTNNKGPCCIGLTIDSTKTTKSST